MATAIDAAQVTYEAPDLEVMEKFLTAFGMTKVEGSDENTLYMRGNGTQHHIHVSRRADKQRFVGASIEVATRADLEELAAKPGSSPVRESTDPGGGYEVVDDHARRIRDPRDLGPGEGGADRGPGAVRVQQHP